MRACVGMFGRRSHSRSAEAYGGGRGYYGGVGAVMLLIMAGCVAPLAMAMEPSEARVEVGEPVPVEIASPPILEAVPVKVGVRAPLETVPPPAVETARSLVVSTPPSTLGFEQWFGLGRGANRPLVVRSTQKELDVAAVVEDMSVMSGIFEKALQDKLGQDFASSRLIIGGGSVWALSGFRGIQGIYLEGHGLLFMMRVKFPLVPPPEVKAPKVEEGADSVWEQTKREVLGTGKALATERQAYDADKVAILKKILLEALKHASNIRNLHPEESIAVVLLGGNATGGMRIEAYSPARGVRVERRRRDTRTYITHDSPPGALLTGPRQATVLTVHVKKSDVDAFAEGKLTVEEFGGRATITAY